MGFSSFFIRTSAGPFSAEYQNEPIGFSSFFIRTSAGHDPHVGDQAVRFSSFFIRTSAGQDTSPGRAFTTFQFLLHQDFGRTFTMRQWRELYSFSSFFIRTSAGPFLVKEYAPR